MRVIAFVFLLSLATSHLASSRRSSSSSSDFSSSLNHHLSHSRHQQRQQQAPASGGDQRHRRVEDLDAEEPVVEGGKNCTRCLLQDEARTRRLEEVKMEILRKLGLSQAPNVTVRDLPRIPPLENLLSEEDVDDEEYLTSRRSGNLDDDEMMSDAPIASPSSRLHYSSASGHAEEFEDFYVNTEKSITFARIRESHSLSFLL